MRPTEDLPESPRACKRNADRAEQSCIKQANGQKGAYIAVGLHQLVSRLGGIVDVDTLQHSAGHDDDKDGDNHSDDRTQQRVEPTPGDILLEHALVDYGTLLEEQHPRSDRGADVGHQEEEHLAVKFSGKVWDQSLVYYVANGRVNEESAWDINQVQCTEEQCQLFKGPIPTVQYDHGHQHNDRNDRDPRGNAKNGQRGRHANELGDERQPVDDHQIQQRKPAPERTEAIEDRFRVSALGDGAETHRHLLDVVGDRDQQHQDPDQVVAVLGPGRGIGRNATGIVVRNHDDQTGSGDDQVESDRFPRLAKRVIESCKEIHGSVLALRHKRATKSNLTQVR